MAALRSMLPPRHTTAAHRVRLVTDAWRSSVAGGLAIGVQIIGRFLENRTAIAFAGCMEVDFGGFSALAASAT
jgi:hypothetical protein